MQVVQQLCDSTRFCSVWSRARILVTVLHLSSSLSALSIDIFRQFFNDFLFRNDLISLNVYVLLHLAFGDRIGSSVRDVQRLLLDNSEDMFLYVVEYVSRVHFSKIYS